MAPIFDVSEEMPERGSGLCLHVQSSLINSRGEPLEMEAKREVSEGIWNFIEHLCTFKLGEHFQRNIPK